MFNLSLSRPSPNPGSCGISTGGLTGGSSFFISGGGEPVVIGPVSGIYVTGGFNLSLIFSFSFSISPRFGPIHLPAGVSVTVLKVWSSAKDLDQSVSSLSMGTSLVFRYSLNLGTSSGLFSKYFWIFCCKARPVGLFQAAVTPIAPKT